MYTVMGTVPFDSIIILMTSIQTLWDLYEFPQSPKRLLVVGVHCGLIQLHHVQLLGQVADARLHVDQEASDTLELAAVALAREALRMLKPTICHCS